jgi:hypothetical protein
MWRLADTRVAANENLFATLFGGFAAGSWGRRSVYDMFAPRVPKGAEFSPLPESYMKPGAVVDMRGAPASSATNAAGFPRNGPWFWRQMAETNPNYFDAANAARIRANRSPLINDTWVENFPQHQGFIGEKLVHHHIDQGPIATPIPEIIHQQWYKSLHPNQ